MKTPNPTPDIMLATVAADLLSLVIGTAYDGSNPEDVERAAILHDSRKLYPRLTITTPHGGGAVRLELALCDPVSDAPMVSMFSAEAVCEVIQCH